MVRDGAVSCYRRSEKIEGGGFDVPPFESEEVHVLAVDDSLVDRKVIEKLLRISSCKVTAVDSGRRALQFLGLGEEKSDTSFDGLKVDLIITDYCMPGMTGYELLKKIKGSSNFREIPVVIMSSENVLARIDSCLQEGAEDFLLKPVKLADVKRLRNYMSREERAAHGGNKRKLREESCDLLPSPPASSSPSPPAPSPSSSSSPSPPSSSSPSPLESSLLPPPSSSSSAPPASSLPPPPPPESSPPPPMSSSTPSSSDASTSP